MTDVFATIIVTASEVEEARLTASQFVGGNGMFTTGLSETGDEPATHYISSGLLPVEIVDALVICDVSVVSPSEAMQAAGLKLCAPEEIT